MTAVKVLVPAANLLVNTVMPVIFWLAAIDAGKKIRLLGDDFRRRRAADYG
ncbi:Putative inner membrane protein [Klebsiella pneumoniae IS39]|nr:Putative inner membrane protein [Klebsiella pneumoniae IS39]